MDWVKASATTVVCEEKGTTLRDVVQGIMDGAASPWSMHGGAAAAEAAVRAAAGVAAANEGKAAPPGTFSLLFYCCASYCDCREPYGE